MKHISKFSDQPDTDAHKMRIDKWLWAARFFKTRALAIDAIDSGKVLVNEARVKPAKTIDAGDMLAIRLGPYTFVVAVLALSDKRGPAPQAQKLYQETDASITQREVMALERKAQEQIVQRGEGRPTKKARREIERFKNEVW